MIRCLLLFPLLLVFGCGLADYEAHMLESQKRVERFDEENRLLGVILQIPTKMVPSPSNPKVEVSAKLVNVSIRPPKGIDTVFNPALWQGKFYQYFPTPVKAPGVQPGNFQPGQPNPAGKSNPPVQPGQPPGAPANPTTLIEAGGPIEGMIDVLLAWDDTDLETTKFSEEILKFFTSVTPLPLPLIRTVNVPRRPAFNCEMFDIADAGGIISRIVIRKQNKVNLAVVYRVANGKLQVPQVSRALDLSVESIFFLPDPTAKPPVQAPISGK